MAFAPASVWILAVVLGQSPEPVTPVPPATPATKSAPRLLAPLPPPRPERGEEYVLNPAGDGSGDLIYDGSRFRARVAADGSVTFDDKRVTALSGLGWLPAPAQFGVPSLQLSLKMLLKGKSPPRPPEPDDSRPPPETTQVIPEVTRYRPDPREGCRTCGFEVRPVLVNAVGRFDLTDELVRMNGKDPLRYEKARFLVATREARFKMAAKAHADNIRRAKSELPLRLHAIACAPELSVAEKRGILMALRDEMNTTTEGIEAAARIREFLIRFDAAAGSGVTCPGAR